MKAFPYPTVEYRGADALTEWAKLHKRGKSEGFHPIILGGPEELELLTESYGDNKSDPSTILEQAASLNGADFLKRRVSQEPEFYDECDLGEWPARISHQPIVSHLELGTGKPKTKVFIAQIPTVHSWEVPAYLKYGAWNDCPAAEEHVALHRMWNEMYGADIMVLAPDVIECVVARPPVTNEAAMALARQQFVYCTDIVHQGVETLSALAAGLKGHSTWYLWWD